MLNCISICAIFLLILWDVRTAKSTIHKSGTEDFGVFIFREENLFARIASNTRNYTLAYNFLQSGVAGVISYVQLDVNGTQESVASIDFPKTVDIKENRNVKATVQIPNARNFTSKITIRGTPGFKYDELQGLEQILNIKKFHPRSYSLLCTLNNAHQFKWKNVLFEYGHRTDNDIILHLQRQFMDTKQLAPNSIPKFTFAFDNEQINVNHVSVTADSPWAIVFHNKINVTQHGFRATVYGLDRKPFTTQLTIFGTHT